MKTYFSSGIYFFHFGSYIKKILTADLAATLILDWICAKRCDKSLKPGRLKQHIKSVVISTKRAVFYRWPSGLTASLSPI